MANIYQTTTLNKAGKELYHTNEAYDKNDVVKVVTSYVDAGGNTTSGSTANANQPNNYVQKKYYFYYAKNNLSANSHGSDYQTPTLSDDYWGGLKSKNGKLVPEFFWRPSYGSSVENQPKVQKVVFGDGYEQRVADSINFNLIRVNLTFEKRRKKEATAILHFLNERKGLETFLFSPPEPYNPINQTYYVCRNWSSSFTFFDNYTINATFEEVAG